MISTPTTLVLGAGASRHLNYPLGPELVQWLAGRSGADHEVPGELSAEEIDDFLTRMKEYRPDSIDEFLEIEERADIGRYMLASALKRHESLDLLLGFSGSPGWYTRVFNALLDGQGRPAFADSELRVVTFNYDRSFEVFLHERVKRRFQLSHDDAADLVRSIPLVHVHGSLGSYPEVPYQAEASPEELLSISQQIKVVSEVADPDDGGFASPEFETANRLLEEAERIFFLGFGFYRDNVRRFKYFSPDAPAEKVRGTLVMDEIDRREVVSRLRRDGVISVDGALNSHKCDEFFSRDVRLPDE